MTPVYLSLASIEPHCRGGSFGGSFGFPDPLKVLTQLGGRGVVLFDVEQLGETLVGVRARTLDGLGGLFGLSGWRHADLLGRKSH
jgi:hypothetical protein